MAGAGSGARRLMCSPPRWDCCSRRSCSAIWRCSSTAQCGAASAAAPRAFFDAVEMIISGLIAPVMMLIQSIRSSRSEGPRQRLAGATARRRQLAVARPCAATAAHAIRSRAGARRIRGLVLAVRLDDAGIVGLLLAIPLAQWSASPAAGRRMRRNKLLLTPEESEPPQILERANALALELPVADLLDVIESGLASPIQPCSQHIARCCRRELRASAGWSRPRL